MESKKRSLIFSIGLTLLLSCFRPSNGCCGGERERGFKGMFVFGSSVVDNGNNNHLVGSSAKSNYKPYGVDYPSGPTGRFTNGKTIADFVADHLGIPLVPAFWDPRTKGYGDVHGVNYGSGGSGILDATGITAGAMSLNTQIKEFEKVTVPELEAAMRSTRHEILPEYLVMVAAGNNDYGFNYFLGQTPKVTPQAFTQSLISIYSLQLKQTKTKNKFIFLIETSPKTDAASLATDLRRRSLPTELRRRCTAHRPPAPLRCPTNSGGASRRCTSYRPPALRFSDRRQWLLRPPASLRCPPTTVTCVGSRTTRTSLSIFTTLIPLKSTI